MQIIQTCGADCRYNRSIVAEGVASMAVIDGRLSLNGEKQPLDCPRCNKIIVWIAENEPRRTTAEAHKQQTAKM